MAIIQWDKIGQKQKGWLWVYGTSILEVFLWLSLRTHLLCKQETYSCTLRVTGQVWQNQKRISININYNYHHRSSLLLSLNWSNGKTRFNLNQPNNKRWRARLIDVIKHLHHKVFLLSYHHHKGGQPRLKRYLFPMGYNWPCWIPTQYFNVSETLHGYSN